MGFSLWRRARSLRSLSASSSDVGLAFLKLLVLPWRRGRSLAFNSYAEGGRTVLKMEPSPHWLQKSNSHVDGHA
eukprot:5031249-Pyramimonas_sp.AAC.1